MDCLSNSLFKANPAEYMAAVLSNNMSDIKQVSFFMEECKRMGLEGPDVNESHYKFTVNDNYAAVWDDEH
jgi:DNA polymerase-3 subunit alpha